MFSWFRKSKNEILYERIVSAHRCDIFVQPPKEEIIELKNETNDVIRRFPLEKQEFTPEFRKYCKEYYSKYIRPDNYYIQFSFMAPFLGKTYENDTKIEIIDYRVCWGNCDYGYIDNPKNNREYIPMKPVFDILCELMNETGRPYTVNVNMVKHHSTELQQDNMLLTFCFVQNSK